eukprot:CAMPEP_0196668080 /NCGR_PEP_ID=MMETSP1086-20130531/65432_1 /TAXON_ID=77921 /ORGANISM="Cyanoptyche  gloeocystis , Strain SAG4.97" /LENGTH=139 /DNA_ID=CAMNT_0042005465 /DNA_START=56 /DNA_END=476 /DNA_ORIENTATION=-
MTQQQIEQTLMATLGVRKVVWLGGGVHNDIDTNGHVDNLCCFIRPAVIALTWTDDVNDPQYPNSLDAFKRLSEATDARGRRFEIHKIYQPDPIYVTQADTEDLDPPEHEEVTNEGLASACGDGDEPPGGLRASGSRRRT